MIIQEPDPIAQTRANKSASMSPNPMVGKRPKSDRWGGLHQDFTLGLWITDIVG